MANGLALGIMLGALAVAASSVHAGIAPDLKCKDAKAKATGLKAFELLKTFMHNKKKPNSDKLVRKISKVESNFTKAFSKAESKWSCATTGDSAAVEAEVDSFVASVLGRLCPTETTTTTTSIVTSTTSTTAPPTSSTSTTTTSPATSTTTTTLLPSGSLVINEIDYDQPDADDHEFVEIFNPTSGPVSLEGLALVFVNGSTSTEYRRIDLSAGGILPFQEYVVVGSPSLLVPPSTLKFDLPSSGAIQNGPDGVALVDTATQTVIDVLSYEGEITAATIQGFSEVINLVEGTAFDGADSASETRSLVRSPNGSDTDDAVTDWTATDAPTPGAANA